ncbi:MAG: prolyl oligopeptidase [Saprospiraceae bacterium]|jgi:prolyl oligopeptidase
MNIQNSVAFLLCLLIVGIGCKKEVTPMKKIEVSYPDILRDISVVDNYHGTEIADPYRWLEDDNSEETKQWVGAQNKTTFGYLEQIPYRQKVVNRLTELWDYEKYGSPFKRAGNYYYFKNDGLQNQSVLYKMNPDGVDEVILNPNKFSDDGTSSLAGMAFSKNGKYLGYLVSQGGSDWRTASVLDLESGELLSDNLKWIKFSGVSWKADGFYYSRYPISEEGGELSAKNEYHSLYYHKLGEDQSEDELVYRNNEHPQRNVFGSTSEDERWLFIYGSESTSGNSLKVKDLNTTGAQIATLVEGFDADYSVVDADDNRLIIKTNADAAKEQLLSVSVDNLARGMSSFIPESEDVLQGVSVAGGKMFLEYLHNASSMVKIYDLEGNYLSDLELPGIGNVGISGKKEDNEAFFSFSSFTIPTSIFSLNTETLVYETFKSPQIDFDFSAYETKQLWYESYDGTKVPMFVTHRKDIKLDGSNPTLLYAYGGFNISITPNFALTMLPMLENGGVYAVANIRGGGEFGKEWHEAGTKERKQNVFDDFQAAAEFLISEKYTSPEKLAIRGGSNGGLLVGASITQRPDLFAVAFPAVGVLDMLRYHEFTIGWAWAADYGRSDDPEAFEYLKAYSPLHNVNPVAYPATMITTADHDDRVVPAHSFKFASELQHQHTGDNPVLIRVETSAGHGAGKPTSKIIEESADILSFMFYNMNENMSFEVKG